MRKVNMFQTKTAHNENYVLIHIDAQRKSILWIYEVTNYVYAEVRGHGNNHYFLADSPRDGFWIKD